MLKAVPRPELISSPCIASFVDGEAIQVSPSPAESEVEPLGTGGDTHTHTLEILCTELKAVPHAGLGFQFLRVHV